MQLEMEFDQSKAKQKVCLKKRKQNKAMLIIRNKIWMNSNIWIAFIFLTHFSFAETCGKRYQNIYEANSKAARYLDFIHDNIVFQLENVYAINKMEQPIQIGTDCHVQLSTLSAHSLVCPVNFFYCRLFSPINNHKQRCNASLSSFETIIK